MKAIAVFPWESQDTSALESWVRNTTIPNRLAAWVLKLRNVDEGDHCQVNIFTCVADDFIRQDFRTIDEAKQFVDDFLEKNSIRTLPAHMMVLK